MSEAPTDGLKRSMIDHQPSSWSNTGKWYVFENSLFEFLAKCESQFLQRCSLFIADSHSANAQEAPFFAGFCSGAGDFSSHSLNPAFSAGVAFLIQ